MAIQHMSREQSLSEVTSVILAGGFGTRFSEETVAKPKPMIEIAEKPMLYHIMKQYSIYGVKKFLILTGYKDQVIRNYFLNFAAYNSDFLVNTKSGELNLDSKVEEWNIRILFTGIESQTAQRIKMAEKWLRKEEFFFLTYGDGLANINHYKSLSFHMQKKTLMTVTGINPPGRFGSIHSVDGFVSEWDEKRIGSEGLVSGGFFVVNSETLSHMNKRDLSLETDFLPKLVRMGQLSCYEHDGFWQCMDTQRDREKLEGYCRNKIPPWLKAN